MSGHRTRILVVANRTAASPRLLDLVRRRASAGPSSFTLLVPAEPHGLHRVVDPEVTGRDEARARLDIAMQLLADASASPVDGYVGDSDPIAAISDALQIYGFDEIIVSTLPRRLSRWLKLDLPSKARGFGLPVTHVEAEDSVRVAA